MPPKRSLDYAPRSKALAAEESLLLINISRPLEKLLASGGDGRLALTGQDQRNVYGCTPFPRSTLLDFGSSTASSISEYAYARAQAAQAEFWLSASQIGVERAFDDRVELARNRLRDHLGADGAEIVFSPSGTDAQLQALFLVKASLGTQLVTIIVGADQTGSGTAYTARGQHFSDQTSLGKSVKKGAPIAGLSQQVRTVGIAFCDDAGHLRSANEMDDAVDQAVLDAIGRGEKILLQIMDSSKLGWRAPSDACVNAIATRWPDNVRVVVDACQMRIGRAQLQRHLERGFFVLVTGSKFFTGPAFSGALLVPAAEADAVDAIVNLPTGLHNYSTRFDWPRRWAALRNALSNAPNYGQWLRWEATLEEMNAYFAVPPSFRHEVLEMFAAQIPAMIAGCKNLKMLTERGGVAEAGQDGERRSATIFPFVPQRDGEALPLARCTSLYRAMGRDLSGLLPDDAPHAARRIAALISQIGQPVALRHRPGAVLRLSASARLVSACWARDAGTLSDAMAPALADVSAAIQKLDWLIDHPELYESQGE
jgi:hypothetical protein